MADEKQADKDANDVTDLSSERLTAPAFELEQRRQKIQNEVKQDGEGTREPQKPVNQDG
ncbi:hypothetical protein P7D22_19195 [Lichenihabitans sp. Uapishka_5]|uniref:hypothetical protein n=1 Tax=Lichenihabitans sp. Uapishka_5 TaxID=3037302 RepID=UPI0029E7EF9A|nr:hypothetical protein [Lichenihabitans sp. Uapishka_5]MDX7953293.1 hypothetical protein [Lichenihabitans sp. Uapishka_5]